MTTLELIEDDYEAAREVMRVKTYPSSDHPAAMEYLAGSHARLGDSVFRLYRGLRSPRNEFERIAYDAFHERCTDAVTKARWQAYEERSLDAEIFEALRMSVEERLEFYSTFQKTITTGIRTDELPEQRRIVEAKASRYAHEMCGPTGIGAKKLADLMSFLQECRVTNGIRPPDIHGSTSWTATSLSFKVTKDVRDIWIRCLEVAERSRVPGSPYATTASRLLWERLSEFPSPNQLLTLVYEECALGLSCLRRQAATPEIRIDNHVHVAPSHVTVSPNINVNVGVPPASADALKEETKLPSHAESEVQANERAMHPPIRGVRLENWGIGYREGKKWILFSRRNGKWRPRRTFIIPSKGPTKLLMSLLENGGAIEKQTAEKLLQDQHSAKLPKARSRAVTDALRKVKDPIKAVIARVAKCRVRDVPNPIPNVEPGWCARIKLGFVEFEDKRPQFTPKQPR
jgi:hypothetical protein